MALFQCNLYSESLGTAVSVNVTLPQRATGSLGAHKYPVLYLLHGLLDDHSAWCRYTSVERYAGERGIAVVMPGAARSFYADMAHGYRYWSYVSKELPLLMRHYFPLSTKREETFVAGLSMGGYGAFKLALSYPRRFAAAASLSGAMRDFSAEVRSDDPAWVQEMRNVFGDLRRFPGSRNDIFHLAEKVARGAGPVPLLFQWCGTEDFLYADNLRFRDHAQALGLPLTYEESPGGHEWRYWDTMIERVLGWLPLEKSPWSPVERAPEAIVTPTDQ